MLNGCPGASNIKGAPTLKIKLCPECGNEIELFSCDVKTSCTECGFVAYNDSQSCISWCNYAKDCIGENLYNQFMEAKNNIKKEKTVQ